MNDLAQNARLDTPAEKEEIIRRHWSWLKLGLKEAINRAAPEQSMANETLYDADAPDFAIRKEARGRLAAWSTTLEAEVSAAFLRTTLAADALRVALGNGDLPAFGVPATPEDDFPIGGPRGHSTGRLCRACDARADWSLSVPTGRHDGTSRSRAVFR